ncbi:MAG TPA: FlgD immunoglobulin-like domain containing protein, partial [Candidatus Krumholzibacteria bacterium]|nr:FlgD immunoglobulin-like domain containing protein [Candidatus Krumholzibacteria bacterium]
GILIAAHNAFATPIQWTVGSGGNGHYYDIAYVAGGISWSAANTAATSAGGHLATITSAAEGAFVYANLVDNPTYWNQEPSGSDLGPWLGGYQTSDNGSQANANWVWVTGEPWSYTDWHSGEPNNFTGALENYLSYKCAPTAGCRSIHWNDLPDNISVFGTPVRAYAVEWDAPTSVSTPSLAEVRIRAVPNPFSGSTRVSITTQSKQSVRIGIYDASGRRIRVFSPASVEGEYSVAWDGTDSRGQRVPSGIYFARAITSSGSVVTRLALIR